MRSIDVDVTLHSPGNDADPFWPTGRELLQLSFEGHGDKLVARGHDPRARAAVLETELRRDQKDAFVAAVREGRRGRRIDTPANENENQIVVITGDGPGDGPGPRIMYQLDLSPDRQDTKTSRRG